jgi:hypothetical protein
VATRIVAESVFESIECELLHECADLEGEFEAVEVETGRVVRLNGWLWEVRRVPDEAECNV